MPKAVFKCDPYRSAVSKNAALERYAAETTSSSSSFSRENTVKGKKQRGLSEKR
jgi:hypothetical protein